MRRRLSAATGIILALSLGVAACSQEVEPTVAPPTTSAEASTEPTTSAAETTPTAPDVPKPDPADFPGKDEQTEEGAQQAVRYYWAMLLWGYQTGETEELEILYSSECGNCVENTSSISELSETNSLWIGGEIRNGEVSLSTQELYDYVILYNFSLTNHQELATDGWERVEIPNRNYLTGAGVKWESTSWKIVSVNFEIEGSS